MPTIMVTGDIHGTYDRYRLSAREWKGQKAMTKSDYLLILGDVAMLWHQPSADGSISSTDKKRISYYERKPFTTLFIDGNHENHDLLNSYPVTEWNGGKVHRISDSVYHLMRGQVFDLCGKKLFTMGGARSIDKEYRKEGKSWWASEMPSAEEYSEAVTNLQRCDMKVDYVLTHDCPSFIANRFSYGDDPEDELTEFLQSLINDYGLQFTRWYFGHHHMNRIMDSKKKFICLYQSIINIDYNFD